MSVPTSKGRAPNRSALTFQSLPNTKPSTPSLANAGRASPDRRTKKSTISARISAARAISPYLSVRSGKRASGDRSRIERSPPLLIAAASIDAGLAFPPATAVGLPGSGSQRRSVALQARRGRLGLREHGGRKRRVVGLREHRLSRRAQAVADELAGALRRAFAPG